MNSLWRPGRHRGDTTTSVQRRWNECCQSIEQHRFDCTEGPEDRRSAGPLLPVSPMSPRQLVDRLRADG